MSLYEKFGCDTIVDLVYKIDTHDSTVQGLIDFINYVEDTAEKNFVLSFDELGRTLDKHTIRPKKNDIAVVYCDIKAKEIATKTYPLGDLESIVKDAFKSLASVTFLAHHDEADYKNVSAIKSGLQTAGIPVADIAEYNPYTNSFTTCFNDQHATHKCRNNNEHGLVNDTRTEYSRPNNNQYYELAEQYAITKIRGKSLNNDEDYIKLMLQKGYQNFPREIFGLVHINDCGVVVDVKTYFSGGVSSAIVDPKYLGHELLKEQNTSGVVIFHNHPSGNKKASDEDIAVTKRLTTIIPKIGINVYDHYILARESVYAFAKDGIQKEWFSPKKPSRKETDKQQLEFEL